MTDLVGRLRSGEPTPLERIAADEIERLRQYESHHGELMQVNADMGKEIERLRAELDAATRLLHKQGYNRSEWWTDD